MALAILRAKPLPSWLTDNSSKEARKLNFLKRYPELPAKNIAWSSPLGKDTKPLSPKSVLIRAPKSMIRRPRWVNSDPVCFFQDFNLPLAQTKRLSHNRDKSPISQGERYTSVNSSLNKISPAGPYIRE